MRQILQTLIVMTILFSCEGWGKEQPILHEKTVPFTCDNKYFVKLLNNEVNLYHIVISNDGNGFYTITDSGIIRYNINGIQKKWKKSFYFGGINKHFIRSDKKIWLLSTDNPGPYNRSKTVYLIDTIGNIFLTKKVNMFANNIVGDNNGFTLAYTGLDSTEWVDHAIYKRIGKYFVESYDEGGNLLWKKGYDLISGRIDCLCRLTSNEILVGGYIDSLDSHGGHGIAYLAKLGSTGVVKWEKTFPPDKYRKVFSIKSILEKNKSYNLIIASNISFHLLEIDTSGLTNWVTEIDGYFTSNEHLLYVDSRYIILYSNYDDIKISSLNESGVILWSHDYGGTGIELASSVNVLPSLDMFITGSTRNWDGINYIHYFSNYFIRTDKDGNSCY